MTSVGVLDVIAEVRHLLEPDDQVEVDEGAADPPDWAAAEEGRLYTFHDPARLREVPFETGPTSRQEFAVLAVLVAPTSEWAQRRIDTDMSTWLDEKRGQYLEAVRRNRTTVVWHHIQAAERMPPRLLTKRGIAIELTGYRLVGG